MARLFPDDAGYCAPSVAFRNASSVDTLEQHANGFLSPGIHARRAA